MTAYSLTYTKSGLYWYIEAKIETGAVIASLSHLEGEGRPYLIVKGDLSEAFYPTYSEACSVFMNLLRQGR